MFDQFKKIGEEIYLYENFVSNDQCNEITEIINRMPSKNLQPWWPGKNILKTIPIKQIDLIRNKILNIVPDGMLLGESSVATVLSKGTYWDPHADVHDFSEIEEIASSYVEGTPYKENDLSIYGTVVYFNSFEGGEIYYPTQGITHTPKPGDLLIHSSGPLCFHGVRPLISESRYSYSNHIYKKVRTPA
jgi:hypothetical protein